MGVFKSMRDLTQQAREIERSMPPAGDRMAAAPVLPRTAMRIPAATAPPPASARAPARAPAGTRRR